MSLPVSEGVGSDAPGAFPGADDHVTGFNAHGAAGVGGPGRGGVVEFCCRICGDPLLSAR